MTPDGKWRSAAINVEEDSIEVYSRRDRVLVARFAPGQVERGMSRRRRSKAAITFGSTWGLSWGLTVGMTALSDEYSVRELNGKAVAVVAVIGAAVSTVIAVTRAKRPYIEIKDGTQSIRLRVGKSRARTLRPSSEPVFFWPEFPAVVKKHVGLAGSGKSEDECAVAEPGDGWAHPSVVCRQQERAADPAAEAMARLVCHAEGLVRRVLKRRVLEAPPATGAIPSLGSRSERPDRREERLTVWAAKD